MSSSTDNETCHVFPKHHASSPRPNGDLAAVDALHHKVVSGDHTAAPTTVDDRAATAAGPPGLPQEVLRHTPLCLRLDTQGGRGLVACKEVVAGEVVLSEAPVMVLATPSKDARNVRHVCVIIMCIFIQEYTHGLCRFCIVCGAIRHKHLHSVCVTRASPPCLLHTLAGRATTAR